jgi:CPA2 family monovalent cation:H+ antiporter-2
MIIDLALILGAAAVSTLVFSKLRQPIVLGYLIAGFAVGPHFPLWPNVADTEGVKLWAEIGVIFLLFGLGLEFSFKKLAKVGRSAFISATFEILTMTVLGYLFGKALGWTTMDSIYLGTILSMSSTTIIIRAFDEAGLKGKAFASLVFGILIVEDLMAILLMVILSAISVPGSFSGSKLVFLSGRLLFFLMAWFLVGIYILPSLLKRVRKLLSNEIMLIVSIALCLMMVILATKASFSAALGAFIMGSILAETEEGERIEHLLVSVKDLFAAVFFVSVGMMIDPSILRDHFGVVILITLLTIFGKLLGSGFGALLSGRSLRHSTQAGMSLAQIGEFSFIIATLGVSLNVVSDFLYPIIIAVSAVTTFTTPYLIRYSDPLYTWIEKRLPQKFLERLAHYERAMLVSGKESILKIFWKSYGPLILLNAVVVLVIGLASSQWALPLLLKMFGNERSVRFLACVVTLVACSPFLSAVVLKVPKKIPLFEAESIFRLRSLQLGITIIRAVIGLVLIDVIISRFATTKILPFVVLVATPLMIYFFRGYIGRLYSLVENRFLKNLNAKELADLETLELLPQLAPWNATLTRIDLTPESRVVGQTLEECKFRTNTGATVGMIDRGNRRIFAPGRGERLLPGDQLLLIGTEEQIAAVRELTKPEEIHEPKKHDEHYNLESVAITGDSPYAGKSIREIGFGDQYSGIIVGIEKNGIRILNPESFVILEAGDLVWIFGHKNKIRDFKKMQ